MMVIFNGMDGGWIIDNHEGMKFGASWNNPKFWFEQGAALFQAFYFVPS